MGDSGTDDVKRRFVQLYMDGSPGYCVPIDQIGSVIQSEMESLEDEGEGFKLKIHYMTNEQYDKAPEFEGW